MNSNLATKFALAYSAQPLENCINYNHVQESNLKQHPYNTRQKFVPNLPNVKSMIYHRSILFTSVKAISGVPSGLRETKPFKLFVTKCKKYLLETGEILTYWSNHNSVFIKGIETYRSNDKLVGVTRNLLGVT